ncbi:hypothetical protein [Halopseudomonas sabulinigri]|uniref:Uncharacterized protein n=1 Tax=Halopseudomonas sabulinigri TaxID=472181 RepID=A0ABP9ZUN7_9GAMM
MNFVGGLALVVLCQMIFNHVRQYDVNMEKYRDGEYHYIEGYISDVDDKFRAYEKFTVKGVSLIIDPDKGGCYSILSRDNVYLKLGSYAKIKYLEDGCVVQLNLFKRS